MFVRQFAKFSFKSSGQCAVYRRHSTAILRQSARRSMRPEPSFTQLYTQRRHFLSRGAFRQATRKHPILVRFAFVSIAIVSGTLAWLAYEYRQILKKLGNYPENVGLKLRRALYFTDESFKPVQAARAYQQALQLAEEANMDPFSDEVLGIKLYMAEFLIKCSNYANAIQLLEVVKSDCLRWIEQVGDQPGHAHDRNRLLGKAVQISVKLASLYGSEYVNERDKAEQALVWSVETTMKERKRRETEGLKDGEGPWLDDEQTGAQLEHLGAHYQSEGNNYFAAQLFLQALALKRDQDCHMAALLSNLGMAIGLQRPPPHPSTPPPSPEQLRESGRQWLLKAVELARNIEAEQRNSVCDETCVVAWTNLGEFALLDGNVREAREFFERAASMAHAVGFQEGVETTAQALKAIGSGKTHRAKPKSGGKAWW